MTKDAPAFDFYPERWTHGTRLMTKIERCDYMDLLCHQWTDDGLPADVNLLARLLGYRNGSQVPALVLEKFPVAEDGKRRNQRLESERSKQRERIARKSLGASKTNEKRWGKSVAKRSDSESLSDQIATVERVASESPPPTTHHSPLSDPHTQGASASEQGGFWPDPSEYPTVQTVRQWAESVMAPAECADKWHAQRVVERWQTQAGRPMTAEAGPLRALFNSYATSWKARASQQRTNGQAVKIVRPADKSDVKPANMKQL
jgi:uncharacterized protein YdaU (DUF1376 family)